MSRWAWARLAVKHRTRWEQNWRIGTVGHWMYTLKALVCVALNRLPNDHDVCDHLGCYCNPFPDTPVVVAAGPTHRRSNWINGDWYEWDELVVGHGFWPFQWWYEIREESSL